VLKKILNSPLIRHSLWSLIARFTGVALNFAVILIITNRLPKLEAGDLLLLMQFVTGVALFSRVGLDQLLIKEVASAHHSQHAFQRDFLLTSLKGVMGLSLIFIVIWISLSPFIRAHFFTVDNEATITLRDLMLASIGVLFFNLVILNSTFLKAIKKTVAGVLSQNALPAIAFLIIMLIFWESFTRNQTYFNLYTASNILAGILALLITRHYLIKLDQRSHAANGDALHEKTATDVPGIIGIIKKSIPLAPVSIFSYLMLFADTILIGWFLVNDQVADYSVAAKISYVILFFLQALEATIYPRLLNIYQHQPQRTRTFFWQATALVVGVVSSVTLIMYLLSDWLLLAFGEGFMVAKQALGLLLVAQLLRAASLTFSFMFIIQEKVRYLNSILVFALIINLLGNIILINLYGIEGAAIATLIANGFLLFAVVTLFFRSDLLTNRLSTQQNMAHPKTTQQENTQK